MFCHSLKEAHLLHSMEIFGMDALYDSKQTKDAIG